MQKAICYEVPGARRWSRPPLRLTHCTLDQFAGHVEQHQRILPRDDHRYPHSGAGTPALAQRGRRLHTVAPRQSGILGDLLGTELFPEDREAAVGRYSADLLFRDNSERVVVVENMFGPTDHTWANCSPTRQALTPALRSLSLRSFAMSIGQHWTGWITFGETTLRSSGSSSKHGGSATRTRLRDCASTRNPMAGREQCVPPLAASRPRLKPIVVSGAFSSPDCTRPKKHARIGAACQLRPSAIGCRSVPHAPSYLDTTLCSAASPEGDAESKRISTRHSWIPPKSSTGSTNDAATSIQQSINLSNGTVLTKTARVVSPSTSPMKSESRTNTAGPNSLIGWCPRYAPSKTRSTRLSKTILRPRDNIDRGSTEGLITLAQPGSGGRIQGSWR